MFRVETIGVAVTGLALFIVPIIALPTDYSSVPVVMITSIVASLLYGGYMVSRLGAYHNETEEGIATLNQIRS